jgi:hypothetical protein
MRLPDLHLARERRTAYTMASVRRVSGQRPCVRDGVLMSNRARAIIYLLGAALLWSAGGVLIKWIEWNPIAIAGTRSAIAALVLWAVLRRPHFDRSPAQLGGAVAYAATVLIYVTAVKLTTAQVERLSPPASPGRSLRPAPGPPCG